MLVCAAALGAFGTFASCGHPGVSGVARAERPPEPRRIVSLVPSMTEDLFAVGAGDRVVGVSSYTDYPPAAKKLPVVATFASIATERIVALHADLAIGIDAQDRLAGDLRRANIPVVLLHDDRYDDIFRNLLDDRRDDRPSRERSRAGSAAARAHERAGRAA